MSSPCYKEGRCRKRIKRRKKRPKNQNKNDWFKDDKLFVDSQIALFNFVLNRNIDINLKISLWQQQRPAPWTLRKKRGYGMSTNTILLNRSRRTRAPSLTTSSLIMIFSEWLPPMMKSNSGINPIIQTLRNWSRELKEYSFLWLSCNCLCLRSISYETSFPQF